MANKANGRYFVVAILLLLLCWACEPFDEQITNSGQARLGFSQDSVRFDTLFTSVGSITKRFKVYNPNENAVRISDVRLGQGEQSPYRITINGDRDYRFEDELLLGNDSLLILVDVTIDPMDEGLPFLVKDSVLFTTNGNVQDVKLEAFGQDAVFLGNVVLSCDELWTADKPYVLFGSVLVDSLCNLTVEEGTRIYADNGAAMFIQGTLTARGDSASKVIFRNSRLDNSFDVAPGQWGGLIFLEGSKDNLLEHVIIRNSVVGVNLNTYDEDDVPDLVMKQVLIENVSASGILTLNSDVYAENTLVNTCGQFVVANLGGGNYTYRHCTFANYNFLFSREVPAVVFSDNAVDNNGESITNPITTYMENTVVWGRGFNADELVIDSTAMQAQDYTFINNLLKADQSLFEANGNILNVDPIFRDVQRYMYQPDTLSPLIDTARVSEIVRDLDGRERDQLPDIGAYEFEKE
ncbi:MAG: right-handed parallel beta-helix repeat-containing protein [Cyclobacteriaceae bacterium]